MLIISLEGTCWMMSGNDPSLLDIWDHLYYPFLAFSLNQLEGREGKLFSKKNANYKSIIILILLFSFGLKMPSCTYQWKSWEPSSSMSTFWLQGRVWYRRWAQFSRMNKELKSQVTWTLQVPKLLWKWDNGVWESTETGEALLSQGSFRVCHFYDSD